MDDNFVNLPSNLRSRHPSSRNWDILCGKLEKILPDITPYIESGLYTNHFTQKQPEKKIWEGLWQLHVMWALQQNGFTLEQPTNNDDIFLRFQGQLMAVEVTFTNANDPATFHHKVYKSIAQTQGALIDGVDDSLVRQLLVVIDGKEQRLIARQPAIPRFVALNCVSLGNGFSHWDTSHSDVAKELSQEVARKQYRAVDGVFYDFIEYDRFFSNPKLSLIWHKSKVDRFAREFTELDA